MPLYSFEALPQEVVTPRYSTATGGTITGEKIEVGRYSFAPGTGAVPHQHPNEQIMVVLEGKIRVRVGEEEAVLGPFEGFVMEPNVLHQVTAAVETGAVVLSCKNLVGGKGHKIEETILVSPGKSK